MQQLKRKMVLCSVIITIGVIFFTGNCLADMIDLPQKAIRVKDLTALYGPRFMETASR